MTRRADPRAVARVALPAVSYPPGYFTAGIRAHNWPPAWQSQLTGDDGREQQRREAGQRARAVSVAGAIGWGNGTIDLPGTPKTLAPQWQGRSRPAPRQGKGR